LIYAVDFLLGEGKLVLAMRGGTVTEYRDDLPNGSDFGKNYLVIRHDRLERDHDRGENGHIATTFARYDVAHPFSIRRAFALMGIPAENILGARVKQGAPIMLLAERPGFFETDHLRVYVHASAATPGELLPTIPFVFRDLPDDGVPKKGKYYGSGNAPAAALPYSKLHADLCEGRIRQSGPNFVVLENNAPGANEALKDAHLLIWYDIADGGVHYEYKKINTYEGGNRKAILDGAWAAAYPPPVSARYRVGLRPYAHVGDFEKRFTFLARRNEADVVVNFPDGRPFNRLLKTAPPHEPLVQGLLTGGGGVGTNEAHLDAAGNAADHAYNQRHIVIKRDGKIIQYKKILDYKVEAGVKKIFIEGRWDENLISVGTPDTYEIGATAYHRTPPPRPKKMYVANDSDAERYTPEPFTDTEKPYVHHPLFFGNPLKP
jgi:hypothetical protein